MRGSFGSAISEIAEGAAATAATAATTATTTTATPAGIGEVVSMSALGVFLIERGISGREAAVLTCLSDGWCQSKARQ